VPGVFEVGRKRLKGYAWARGRGQRWTTVSEHAKRLMCQSLGIPPNDVRRIYNGVPQLPAESHGADGAAAAAAALVERDRADVRRELALAPDAKVLLSVGRLVPPKGLDRVIKAAPHVLSEFPDVRFVWVGDGAGRDALAVQAREYGVADRIVFAGQRSDVPRFLLAADLFVFPSLFEAFGLALAEAMACGVPVVASDAGGIPELVTHREHGVICRSGDSAALLEALRWALRNPDEMKRMADNARCRAAQFPEQRMIDETLGLLEETAGLPR
jgi:glycosyltransferase involved in cell wall biosynthesis